MKLSSANILRLAAFIPSIVLLLGSSRAFAAFSDLNMPVGVTPISRSAYELHMLILVICVVIGIVVFGAMFYSMYAHRKSKGRTASQFHHSTFAEIAWTIVPFFILIGMAVPATKALIMMEDTSEADITLKVTGYQWKWRYEYMEDGVSYYSSLAPSSRAAIKGDPRSVEHYLLDVDKPVVLPVDTKVRILLASDDVIHAWWVPALGMKKDAIPGFINEMWIKIEEPGTYRGQCAELCGKDHGFMPIVVEAKSADEYKQWIAARLDEEKNEAIAATREWNKEDLVAKGESVYSNTCAACHQLNGEGVPNAFPAIKGSDIATGDPAEHLKLVMNGKPGTAMQAFATQLSDVDLAAVVTYQRNAFGNDAGDMIQPSAVTTAR